MFEIRNKQILADDVKRIEVSAPLIASKVQPGQFVSVSPYEGDERIPLTVVEADPIKGIITLIVQEVGYTTKKLGNIAINEQIFSILGPLGTPASIAKIGTVVCIATGTGTAQMFPIIKALSKAGNKIIGIIGAKTKKSLMLESQMRLTCNKIFITTNDGTYERRGLATDVFKEIIAKNKIDLVYAIGSMDMMQSVCAMTKEKNIKTLVQLTPVMVDCMGMCGSCRVKVGGKVVLACVEGPEFDGHQVDFGYLDVRLNAYKEYDACLAKQTPMEQRQKESTTLTRLIAGILKR